MIGYPDKSLVKVKGLFWPTVKGSIPSWQQELDATVHIVPAVKKQVVSVPAPTAGCHKKKKKKKKQVVNADSQLASPLCAV